MDVNRSLTFAVSTAAPTASQPREWPEWLAAELDEVNSLVRMGVFQWVPNSQVPNGSKRLKCNMVYKDKCATPGVPARKGVRGVGRGFMETADEYGDCFVPVCRQETYRAFFASAAKRNDSLCSIDVKSAFLTAPIHRTVYLNAPEWHKRPELQYVGTSVNKALGGARGASNWLRSVYVQTRPGLQFFWAARSIGYATRQGRTSRASAI